MFLTIKLLSFDKQNTSKWQYAVLNVATLHYHFGHLQEARLAILEAIKVKTCLLFGLERRNFALIITNRLHKKAVITSALPSAFSGFIESWMVHLFWAHVLFYVNTSVIHSVLITKLAAINAPVLFCNSAGIEQGIWFYRGCSDIFKAMNIVVIIVTTEFQRA
jgi:hypothetical protein